MQIVGWSFRVSKYVVKIGMAHVKIQCGNKTLLYLQLKKKDIHVLSNFPLWINIGDEPMADALPLRKGNAIIYLDNQLELMQTVMMLNNSHQ